MSFHYTTLSRLITFMNWYGDGSSATSKPHLIRTRISSAIPFIGIPTTNGDIVLIDTRPRRLMTDLKLDLLTEAIALMTNYYRACQRGWSVASRYSEVVLPMVSHTMRWHHTDLVGAYGVGVKTARVGLAYEETYLSLSEDGERPAFGSYDGRWAMTTWSIGPSCWPS